LTFLPVKGTSRPKREASHFAKLASAFLQGAAQGKSKFG
jgi:hypothetical protein